MRKTGKTLVYVVCVVIGAAIGHYLFEGTPAAYASILISYHLYLFFLIATAKQEDTRSLTIGKTLLEHSVFLIFLLALAYGRKHIPLFFVVRMSSTALALLEVSWLLSGKLQQTVPAKKVVEEAPPPVMAEATIDDHEAFREHMMQPHRPFRKPGISITEEFNLWLADRQKKRAQAESLAAAAQTAEPAASGTAAIE